MQRVSRRTSFGSTTSLRRSSVSAKDIQAIQAALQKQQRLSSQVVLLLLPLIPLISFIYLYSIHLHQARFIVTMKALFSRWPFLLQIFPPVYDLIAWKIVLIFLSLQLLFHSFLPHDVVKITSSSGEYNRNVNGFASFVLISLLYIMGSLLGLYRGDILFLRFNSVLLIFSILALLTIAILCVCYRLGETYNITTIQEFYFGIDVHPMILDIDIKYFTRSRITYAIWPLFIISALFYQYTARGKITKALIGLATTQLLYIAKYHWNEDLAMSFLDERRAHCGFFRLWSDLVFNPLVYSSPIVMTAYSAQHLSLLTCSIFTLIGITAITLTAMIDRQKFEFRASKGALKIKGVDAFFIAAKYKTESGESAANLLLGSGFWSYCRHPNYVMEILTFFSFVLFQGESPLLSYFPLIYVTGFLLVRLFNDESRCLAKYGQYWLQYTNKVPFKILPGVF
ncbi:unnamed protein product [Auanema sp. JU1783]|nr:unnamed protein product [Auanema sp. JU1783]